MNRGVPLRKRGEVPQLSLLLCVTLEISPIKTKPKEQVMYVNFAIPWQTFTELWNITMFSGQLTGHFQ